jgi:antirestriction protein ArdC
MQKFDIYQMVTNLIVQRLEAGVVPWQMPWKSSGGMPRNLVSKKLYRGINFWYLLSFGFESPWFLTFNQVKELGGSIKKGSKSFEVVFWKMFDYIEDDTFKPKQVPMLRYYRVFHIDQVEGIPENKIPDTKSHDHDFNPIEGCDELITRWTDCPVIETGKGHACYIPSLDKVQLPNPRTFYQDEHYYSTLFHELVHSTGHRKRLDRHSKFSDHRFGSRDYSQEELVAEMGASYLCGLCGIENVVIDNSAAYIQSWLNKLKSDNKFIVQAASYAQKAMDYILEHQVAPAGIIAESEKEAEVVSFSF